MKNRGMTIIEALFAIVLISIALGAIAPSLTSYKRINDQTELRTGGVSAAQQVLDGLRRQTFENWPHSGATATIQTGLADYQTKVTYASPLLGPCADDAADCPTDPSTRYITVEVKHDNKVVYEVETVYTRFD